MFTRTIFSSYGKIPLGSIISDIHDQIKAKYNEIDFLGEYSKIGG